jgi:hypothetical protein
VGRVHEFFQVFGRTIATAGREEVVYLVPEAGIVGMFHDGHKLNDIIPQILNPGEHVLGELLVRGNSEFGRRDANMRLVYPKALGLLRAGMLELIFIFGSWVPEPSIIGLGYAQVLGDILDPGGKAIYFLAIGKGHRDLQSSE